MGTTFVGFGFGAIQAGLFLYEAHAAGRIDRLVVAEVVPRVVQDLRAAGGVYTLNVAHADGVRTATVDGVEVLNPREPRDREALVQVIADADVVTTALPSVAFYGEGAPDDVCGCLVAGLRGRARDRRTLVYTAENSTTAAAQLADRLHAAGGPREGVACLDTVIGKMSSVVEGAERIAAFGLAPVTPGAERAFLVESFNRILTEQVPWADGLRAFPCFVEKADLAPFEQAKLYGHNAAHAWLGYLAAEAGCADMADAARQAFLIRDARKVFVDELGVALCRRFVGVDEQFTSAGFAAYADDLLSRMMNPHLRDSVARVTRDPLRKLGWHDRLIGALRMVLDEGGQPHGVVRGVRAATRRLAEVSGMPWERILPTTWADQGATAQDVDRVSRWIEEA